MALCWLSPVSLTGSAVSLSVTGSSCQSVSALLRTVSALLRQECIYSVFWFLCQRQSLRNTAQVRIFLGAFPEKCNIWLLAQGSCAAPASPAAARSCDRPRKMLLWKFWWGRKEKRGLVSISVCKQFSRFPLPAIELSVWPVCLALFLSKLWKCCWKVMLSLLIFFPFFFLLFSLFYFLLLHRDAGRKQDSGESRESRAARGWGSWGGSRVYVLVCSKSRGFCSCPLLHSLLAARSMIIQPLVITAWVSPFNCKETDHLIYYFNAEKKKLVNQY